METIRDRQQDRQQKTETYVPGRVTSAELIKMCEATAKKT